MLLSRKAHDQRPKNSHNRIITGIGTPTSHSKSPLPIVSSSHVVSARKRPIHRLVPLWIAAPSEQFSALRRDLHVGAALIQTSRARSPAFDRPKVDKLSRLGALSNKHYPLSRERKWPAGNASGNGGRGAGGAPPGRLARSAPHRSHQGRRRHQHGDCHNSSRNDAGPCEARAPAQARVLADAQVESRPHLFRVVSRATTDISPRRRRPPSRPRATSGCSS
jgi:hypothetical protein